MDLLRFTTAGSVDDGKSTLIGRLLYDSQAVYEDQLTSVRKATRNQATKGLDLSLLTDGLRAEREQGITIDVAYRYFSTPRRKFIIADTPGHEQYTRNMATGASTADLAVILIDARHGVLPQSRRHAYIARLLGIPQLVAAVNKMDLVQFREEVFETIRAEFTAFLNGIEFGGGPAQFIPISALDGDNVVRRSQRTPWYGGPSLLEYLETVTISDSRRDQPFRFPVQYVIRPDLHFRGFAGQIAAGTVRRGDEVRILPSEKSSRVKSIITFDGDLPEAFAPMSVTLQLADEIDVSRGDMIAHPAFSPSLGRRFQSSLVWMSQRPLDVNRIYQIKQGAQSVPARVVEVLHRVDLGSLGAQPASRLSLNEIGEVRVECQRPLAFDAYSEIRSTGAFILIDPVTNETAAAGMIRRAEGESGIGPVTMADRIRRQGHAPFIAILSGISWSGAEIVERLLFDSGISIVLLKKPGLNYAEIKMLLQAGIGLLTLDNCVNSDTSSEVGEPFYELRETAENETLIELKKLAHRIRAAAINQ